MIDTVRECRAASHRKIQICVCASLYTNVANKRKSFTCTVFQNVQTARQGNWDRSRRTPL